ncbi:protein red1 [Diplogelasinospora grovesii]|uniref:Protein red1 n=1 Tax=Diplogelasinospora grovesii TaxID=303347 RepID=A0AAN6N845_9PEZI|nr:protein red1 [Diplogelasinospora grovesii]
MSGFSSPHGYSSRGNSQPPRPSGYLPPANDLYSAYAARYNASAAERNRHISVEQTFHDPTGGVSGIERLRSPTAWTAAYYAPATGGAQAFGQAGEDFWGQQGQSTNPSVDRSVYSISSSDDPTSATNRSTQPNSPEAQPAQEDDGLEEGELDEDGYYAGYSSSEPLQISDSSRQPSKPPSNAYPSGAASDDDVDGDAPGVESGGYDDEEPVPAPETAKANGVDDGANRPLQWESRAAPSQLQRPLPGPSNVPARHDPAAQSSHAHQPAPAPPDPSRALQEARKEAKKAILRLWPLGVRYQDYITEGFDKEVIKRLFRELNLDTPTSMPTPEPPGSTSYPSASSSSEQPVEAPQQRAAAEVARVPTPPQDKGSQEKGSKRPDQNGQDKEPTSAPGMSGPKEERKDRIARLLAERAARVAAAASAKPNPPAPAQVKPNATQAESLPPKPKTLSEKDRLLQQKLAALQKSREARAQQPANDKAAPVLHTATSVEQGSVGAQQSEQNAANPVVSASGSASDSSDAAAPSQTRPLLQASSVPSLASSLAPTPIPTPAQSTNQRKRPGPAGFVDNPSTLGSLKRPFGQPRRQPSLVIDVSDDGSNDEEMDMDIDSGEESSSSQQIPTPPQNGSHGTTFPSGANIFSPCTPPGDPANGKKRELDLKEKAIQAMRRKIAEAEARQKAKKSSTGSQTPNDSAPTPDPQTPNVAAQSLETKAANASGPPPSQQLAPVGTPGSSDGSPSAQLISEATSAKLPKPSKVSRVSDVERAQRRGRIASLDLPRIDESLEEKRRRLQQLREEEARLQAEIDQGLAEKKLLTDELEQLEGSPSEGTSASESTGVDSGAPAATTSPTRDSTPTSAASTTSEQDEEDSSDVSMHEGASSQEHSLLQSPHQATSAPQQGARHETGDMGGLNPPEANPISLAMTQVDSSLDDSAASPTHDAHTPGALLDGDGADLDHAAPMDLESTTSSPSSPALGTVSQNEDSGDAISDSTSQEPVEALAQISSVAKPRQEAQEIEAEVMGEVQVVSPGVSGSVWLTCRQAIHKSAHKTERTLQPYESPLRYFRAYRFHPQYRDSVAGGLKSLTYSNTIDPTREFCPYELHEYPCPAGCHFQHIRSIGLPGESPQSACKAANVRPRSPSLNADPYPFCLPDDRILLELGNSDAFSGGRKARFIQGLRELLQDFRNRKVKDFEEIAGAIVEYRNRFLGDRFRVLNLESVVV